MDCRAGGGGREGERTATGWGLRRKDGGELCEAARERLGHKRSRLLTHLRVPRVPHRSERVRQGGRVVRAERAAGLQCVMRGRDLGAAVRESGCENLQEPCTPLSSRSSWRTGGWCGVTLCDMVCMHGACAVPMHTVHMRWCVCRYRRGVPWWRPATHCVQATPSNGLLCGSRPASAMMVQWVPTIRTWGGTPGEQHTGW